MRLFLHAPNIHQGGGAVLLNELLCAIPPELPVVATLDSRMVLTSSMSQHVVIRRVAPLLSQRVAAEWWLCRQVTMNDNVLCFGNLPPLFRLQGKVNLFLQNRYLIDEEVSLAGLPWATQFRLRIERVWLLSCISHAQRVFVQTPTMQRLAEVRLRIPVSCASFVPNRVFASTRVTRQEHLTRFDFIYVASGEAHKNHLALIRAWAVLAQEGFFPSLALTLAEPHFQKLLHQVNEECASKNLQICNLGVLAHEDVLARYSDARALIYPSSFESFGLPLIEANFMGLPVLAPELDYVRDILDPVESFDPESPLSIARAVKRFLAKPAAPMKPMAFDEFLHCIVKVGQA